MNETEENADMIGSRAAMLRAVRRACEQARMHGLPVAISRDGKVVEIPPEDVLAALAARQNSIRARAETDK